MTFDEYCSALEKIQIPQNLKHSKKMEWLEGQINDLRKQLSPEDLEKVLEAERNYKKKKRK